MQDIDPDIELKFKKKIISEKIFHNRLAYDLAYDSFVLDGLPAPELRAQIINAPMLSKVFNAGYELLDGAFEKGYADLIAVRTSDDTYTYQDLLNLSNCMANFMIHEGFIAGTRVLIHSVNNVEMIVLWLAVLRAGGVNVLAMPQLQAHELEYMIDKCKIGYAFSSTELMPVIGEAIKHNETKILHFNLEKVFKALPLYSNVFIPWMTSPDTPCQIAFTSGTTGKPKAAVHTHQDLYSVVFNWCESVFMPVPTDIFYCTAPIAFMYGLNFDITIPFTYGASVLILKKENAITTFKNVEKYKVTVFGTAPTLYNLALQSDKLPDLSSIRFCMTGGEHITQDTCDRWKERTGITLSNATGGTEVLWSYMSARKPGEPMRPSKGYVARIVDKDGIELPPNTVGLLAFRGVTGCKYFDDDRQTKYVKDGWNYPGDCYSMDEQGYFYYHSRSDEMIITSGYNVGPDEIEQVLLTNDLVADCCVVGKLDELRTMLIKAVIVLKDPTLTHEFVTSNLTAYLKHRLALYKQPSEYVYVDKIDVTANGKKQRFKYQK